MLGPIHMRHKFWYVRSPLFIEFTFDSFWNTLLKQRDWAQGAHQGPSSAARERNHAYSPPNTKIHALLLCTWQKHTKEVICEGGSQGAWRSKCCDLLWSIWTRPSSQCQFRRKKEIEFVRHVSLLSEINQQLKQEFGWIAMKRSWHVHVIQTFFGSPLIRFRCFADNPWNGRRIFGSSDKNVRRKSWIWKRKVNQLGNRIKSHSQSRRP